jgi:hypothetical protein
MPRNDKIPLDLFSTMQAMSLFTRSSWSITLRRRRRCLHCSHLRSLRPSNGLSAAIYRLHLDSGDRQLVKTLGMRDSTGGFGVTRVVTTPDGQYFAYNTLRQLSELYLLQGLY